MNRTKTSTNPYESVAALRKEDDYIIAGLALFGENKEITRSAAILRNEVTGQIRLVDSDCRSDEPINDRERLIELFFTEEARSFSRKPGHWYCTHFIL